MKMQLLRWNNAKPNPGHDTRPASSYGDKGLDVANHNRASGGGRRMFLTSPFIEQAITPTTTPKDSFLPGCKRNGDCSPTMWEFVTSRGNYWLCYFRIERGKLIAIRSSSMKREWRHVVCLGLLNLVLVPVVISAGPKQIPEEGRERSCAHEAEGGRHWLRISPCLPSMARS